MIDGTGRITIAAFDGREYTFRLAIGELRALEADRRRGVYALSRSFDDGTWHLDDAISVIRIALRGGGMEAQEVSDIVKNWVESKPPMEYFPLAKTILLVGLFGPPDDPVGKKAEAENPIQNGSNSPP